MKKCYKKRPEIIEAIKYDGTNLDEINEFTKDDTSIASIEKQSEDHLYLQSNRGCARIYIGDYVAEDMTGNIEIFNGKAFEALYEEILSKNEFEDIFDSFDKIFRSSP